ncbi:MAG: exodeoxyribonuclease VII small subunit [Lachnospiraceae bacterium]|jgi:exodeoxyribonuclease VII small subunit|nr:exodeoxyribonuclease VII small subunit [Lachnospiraceae bacterium]
MEEKKELSLEENFDKLEELIEVLSDADVSLEDAFRVYSEGVTLLKTCNDQIDRVEKKVLVLSANGELEELDGDGTEA